MVSNYGAWIKEVYNYVYDYLVTNLTTSFDEYLKQKQMATKWPFLRLVLQTDLMAVGSVYRNEHIVKMQIDVGDNNPNMVTGFETIVEKAGLVVDLLDGDRKLGGKVDDCRMVGVTHDMMMKDLHIVSIGVELRSLRKP